MTLVLSFFEREGRKFCRCCSLTMLLVVVLRKGKEKKERRIGEKGLARCSLRFVLVPVLVVVE